MPSARHHVMVGRSLSFGLGDEAGPEAKPEASRVPGMAGLLFVHTCVAQAYSTPLDRGTEIAAYVKMLPVGADQHDARATPDASARAFESPDEPKVARPSRPHRFRVADLRRVEGSRLARDVRARASRRSGYGSTVRAHAPLRLERSTRARTRRASRSRSNGSNSFFSSRHSGTLAQAR